MSTRLQKIWAVGVLGCCLYLGVAVMFGYSPGANSDFALFERLADLARNVASEHGTFVTGSAIIVIGFVLAAMTLVWSEGSPGFLGSSEDSGCGGNGDGD